VQSVVFPAVPHGAGVLRMQVNANHDPAQIDGLLGALAELKRVVPLPGPEAEGGVIPFPTLPAGGVPAESIPA
jgi:hypothetical protein